jgi:hypothetical protein
VIATKLTAGPLALIRKLARAPEGFRDSDAGKTMATRALELVRRGDSDQADVFLTELVMLGYAPEGVR